MKAGSQSTIIYIVFNTNSQLTIQIEKSACNKTGYYLTYLDNFSHNGLSSTSRTGVLPPQLPKNKNLNEEEATKTKNKNEVSTIGGNIFMPFLLFNLKANNILSAYDNNLFVYIIYVHSKSFYLRRLHNNYNILRQFETSKRN